MLTERQKEILALLVREYIDSAEPVSSKLLKKKWSLDVSPATIRNDLQELVKQGYIAQPHTSAGRVPTPKAYQYFVTITITPEQPQLPDYISREIAQTRAKLQQELEKSESLVQNLRHMLAILDQAGQPQHHQTVFELLNMLRPSRTNYERNISLLDQLLDELHSL